MFFPLKNTFAGIIFQSVATAMVTKIDERLVVVWIGQEMALAVTFIFNGLIIVNWRIKLHVAWRARVREKRWMMCWEEGKKAGRLAALRLPATKERVWLSVTAVDRSTWNINHPGHRAAAAVTALSAGAPFWRLQILRGHLHLLNMIINGCEHLILGPIKQHGCQHLQIFFSPLSVQKLLLLWHFCSSFYVVKFSHKNVVI